MKTNLKHLIAAFALCMSHQANAVFFEWFKYYNGGSTDRGLHVTTDALANVYFTGVASFGGGDKIISSAYADDGTLLWQRTANSYLPGTVKQVERDAALNTFVLCEISPSSFTLIRYNVNAKEKWRRNFSDNSMKFKVGNPAAVFTCGLNSSGVAMERLNKNTGVTVWSHSYADGSLLTNAYHSDFTIDPNSNVYFCGTTSMPTNYDYKMIKLNKNGGLIYNIQYDAGSSEDEETFKIAANSAGELYVLGDYNCYIPVRDFVSMVKFSSTGVHLWNTHFHTTGPDSYTAVEVMVGTDGNPVCVGNVDDFYNVNPSGETIRIRVSKFDAATGAVIFNVTPEDASYSNPDIIERASCMTIDGSNNIYLGGTSNVYAGVGVQPDRWLASRVNGATGILDWVEAGVLNDASNSIADAVVTAGSDVYLAGTENISGNPDMELIKYCQTGCFSPRFSSGEISAGGLVIFPNPSTSQFTLSGAGNDFTLSVYDISGKLLEEHELNTGTINFGEKLAAGIYVARFVSATENKTFRIVKTQ